MVWLTEDRPRARHLPALVLLALVLLLPFGCGRSEKKPAKAARKAAAGEEKRKSRTADVTTRNSTFTAKDGAGRPMISLKVALMRTAFSPGSGIEGPVALQGVRGTLYREGQPSMWLEAPEAAWEDGVLKAVKGVRSGTVDGRLACDGERAEWTARGDRLKVDRARCQTRAAKGTPSSAKGATYDLNAEGPSAVWEAGKLTMAHGFMARTTDGAATLKAKTLTWRAADAKVVASGNVEATRNGGRLKAGRLQGDTRLRRVALGGPPGAAGRPGRASYTFGEWKLEYDAFNADFAADPIPFEASGRVILTGPDGVITAARVTGRATPRFALLHVRALGGVTVKTPEQAGRLLTAQGREAVYDPAKQEVRLTGDARATVTSPVLASPARLDGEQVVIEIPKRIAAVTAAPGARVELTAQLKREPEPLQLSAERLRYDGGADRVAAEGRPTIRDPRGTLTSDRMEVNLAEESNNIMVARAVGNVVVDARFTEPRPQQFAATAREATYFRAESKIALRGDVKGSVTTANSPTPATFAGEELTYDLKTRKMSMSGQPARAQFVPPPRAPRAGQK